MRQPKRRWHVLIGGDGRPGERCVVVDNVRTEKQARREVEQSWERPRGAERILSADVARHQ